MDQKPPTFNEEVVEALMQSALRHGGFTHPVVYLKGTKTVIDGHHRIEAHKRLQKIGQRVKLPTKQEAHDNPEQLARDLNQVRRSWNSVEERRTEAQFLASKNFSTRVIGKVLGVDQSTVVRDLKPDGEPCDADASVSSPQNSRLVHTSSGSTQRFFGDAEKEKMHDLREEGKSFREIAKITDASYTGVRNVLSKPRPSKQSLNDFAQQRGTEWQREADQRVAEIQSGKHPESFKKAVKHFNNFDKLVQSAFDAKDSKGWERYHWNFVKTEINSIVSIIVQRAEEANQVFNEDYVGTAGWRAIECRRSGTVGLLPVSNHVD